ncbi:MULTISPECIES: hypothetical protein [Amycolatopsis]|uniref:DUF4386 family protein n=1 Tax=Amycolatopsis thermalba TaxID=944492 RepID=A0ABY4NX24_9PSEU|nr:MULTISPECIES: hypothetical protein [Amycolatopsis]OXM72385.1 hypothetical protein CF166_15000 [Amycolatopsis sp. KNN50.9b]UQS24593.1 hypothetical protein L1857_18110 [Amycolatopsis thermalba]
MVAVHTGPRSGLALPPVARYLMGASAVLAPLLVAVSLALDLDIAGTSNTAIAQRMAADPDGYPATAWLAAVSTLLWVPAVLTAGRVARRNAPTLGLAGTVLAFGAALPVGLDTEALAYVALKSGVPVSTTVTMMDTAEDIPSGILGFVFFAGLAGLILLGVAIVRGHAAPVWAGAALILAAVAIPVSWFSGSGIAALVAWLVLAAGFAGCAQALITQQEA